MTCFFCVCLICANMSSYTTALNYILYKLSFIYSLHIKAEVKIEFSSLVMFPFCFLFCFFLQQIAFKNLVQRNKQSEQQANRPPPPNSIIHLPFIIVNTSKKTVIDCSISNDKYVVIWSVYGQWKHFLKYISLKHLKYLR